MQTRRQHELTSQDSDGGPCAPSLGTLAVDTDRDRVGVVTGWDGRQVTLRPLAGGQEWQASAFRPADANDELRARVAEANAAGRWFR
ncbi:hypothetical protein [Streptomyces sp. NBC_01262]|uniref:hypothetical protein n=1 Tax=Streptomyces sp. NBC_01262 TaxID=2903803 RepID=UPI002E3053A7|nr:hypothetical protein [Streptomyces sp. NBC_01262]